MRVRSITNGGDWTFGKGRAHYKTKSDAIRQNVLTRLRSFRDDWFLNVNHGGRWFELFGTRGTTERQVLREVERIVLTTEGVRAIERLRVIRRDSPRSVTIGLTFIDLFDTRTIESLELSV